MKFLIGYDGSTASVNAVEEAKKYAKPLQAKLIILTTIPYNPSDPEHKEMEDILQNLKNDLTTDGLDCDFYIIEKSYSAAEHLIDISLHENIDLIFVGVKKKSKLNKLIIGSTAQYLILEGKCPVVTVK